MIEMEKRCATWLMSWGLDSALSADLCAFIHECMDEELSFRSYQVQAHETAEYPEETATDYLLLGLAGETGEILNKYKKVLRGDPEPGGLSEEIGDVLWYLAELCTVKGWTMGGVAQYNLIKLRDRKERGVIKGSGDDR